MLLSRLSRRLIRLAILQFEYDQCSYRNVSFSYWKDTIPDLNSPGSILLPHTIDTVFSNEKWSTCLAMCTLNSRGSIRVDFIEKRDFPETTKQCRVCLQGLYCTPRGSGCHIQPPDSSTGVSYLLSNRWSCRASRRLISEAPLSSNKAPPKKACGDDGRREHQPVCISDKRSNDRRGYCTDHGSGCRINLPESSVISSDSSWRRVSWCYFSEALFQLSAPPTKDRRDSK